MAGRKTIKINEENYTKLNELKDLKGYSSLNETLENLLPLGTVHNAEYDSEPPAFEITGNVVSWNCLRESEVGSVWKSDDGLESAVVVFKDDFGALVRFNFCDEFRVNYFHFLK